MGSYMGLREINPEISVAITTYNSATTIDRVLEALISQDYPHELIEVIVVDGGSIDNTLEIVKSFENKFREAGFLDSGS